MAIPQLQPYVSDTKVDRNVAEYINSFENADIGSNKAGMPKGGKNGMTLQHVGGSVGGAR